MIDQHLEPDRVLYGDCIEVMRTFDPGSIDAVICDPPYAFPGGFGDKDRRSAAQFQSWVTEWSGECLRILKPGGHLVAFGAARTSHRLVSGIEDAGVEIRDSITWLYGGGFPKSMNVGKALDKADGHVSTAEPPSNRDTRFAGRPSGFSTTRGTNLPTYEPTSDAAAEWNGWGTALKPAANPICVAQKPIRGTIVANVLQYGVGALNIDACRVPTEENLNGGAYSAGGRPNDGFVAGVAGSGLFKPDAAAGQYVQPVGRFPSNLLLDGDAADALDEQTGTLTSGYMEPKIDDRPTGDAVYGRFANRQYNSITYADSGGASRFYPVFRYQAKASPAERPKVDGLAHPTVKPLELMRWLVRLFVPVGATVLDPFLGSGTTLEACMLEGMRCIGIDNDTSFAPLVQVRMNRTHRA